jgi:hypothetical protein
VERIILPCFRTAEAIGRFTLFRKRGKGGLVRSKGSQISRK